MLNGRDLPHLVRWNIALILAVTICSIVTIRQAHYRASKGKPLGRLHFIFPGIKRDDADKNLTGFLKYFANYGYYKFGVEVRHAFLSVTFLGTLVIYSLTYCNIVKVVQILYL